MVAVELPGAADEAAAEGLDFGAGPVHFIGVGGSGMSGIARIMLAQGVAVTGSDAKDSRRLTALRAVGADIAVGHEAGNVGRPVAVVASTIIKEDNPEMIRARELGVPVLHRSVALAKVMAGHRGVAVAGTHGKTTTTSMLTVALQNCDAEPSFAIGGELHETGAYAHLGAGDVFVTEADESDGSMLRLGAEVGIITNVEPDHLNFWGDYESLIEAFEEFVVDIGSRDGFVVACIDDPDTRRVIEAGRAAGVDVRTYGFSDEADYHVEVLNRSGVGWTFTVVDRGVRSPQITLQVPGAHNVLNATAAFAAAVGLGFTAVDVVHGLEQFSGTRRRFDFRGEADGIRVFDDFAHHPTEVGATLRAARDVAGDGRIVIAFQAHHYYRTALFVKEFGDNLGLADEVVVLEVFAPGEEPIPGASGIAMADNVPLPAEQVLFEPSSAAVPQHLVDRAQPGDIIMTIGQGDVALMAPAVLDLLQLRQDAR
ncbi:MAG: UDP-N-acetylmuramate--L-alanine ligase [Actinobacteria bacterium]|nr:MAG: UDP-N-acetylmuramate--L-alanine ligase [Actinomycetota bacterium]